MSKDSFQYLHELLFDAMFKEGCNANKTAPVSVKIAASLTILADSSF